jgi:hypothetical protein
MYYSPSTKGFYSSEIHGDNIPVDAVGISDAYYLELLNGQEEGKQISADENGFPVLITVVIDPRPVPEREQLESAQEPTKAELLEQLECLRIKIESM